MEKADKDTQTNPPEEKRSILKTLTSRKAIAITTGVAAGTFFAPVILTSIVAGLGFSAGGIVAGSTAAGMMASVGNVAAGSTVAVLQSIGAAGLSTAGTVVAGGTGAAAGGALGGGVSSTWGWVAKKFRSNRSEEKNT
mmetsp:Transcript_70462/g.82097  ORF Transcript_70462/g.82097 Transcript_70462/m.82097 type:complete len:138 (-) Transcript_70462:224-637(-)|eukprot:CAMPEP_0176446686 /NCGR_PEP_ID=MMETSP0127-20121128/24478_1 /TAXON_ID=938130 /ORGANISM="Platyophrya macrostoma, Strain WH" /LENGTH=137 /DNA_ID=CAMNT_0017832777 /DNA_START=31 /DNA_END=444 /DNA_ORIENTATION=+